MAGTRIECHRTAPKGGHLTSRRDRMGRGAEPTCTLSGLCPPRCRRWRPFFTTLLGVLRIALPLR